MTLQDKNNRQILLRMNKIELIEQRKGVRRFAQKLALPESTLEGSFTDTIKEIEAEIAAIDAELIPLGELQKAAENNDL